jgi:charged multivesicular body protein 7
MISIEMAAGDVQVSRLLAVSKFSKFVHFQILKAYESSTTTLRTILAHSSLEHENINKTMDALAEANQDAKEVDDAIRIGGDMAVGVEIDDEEIEEELKALARDVENSQNTLETLEGLRPPPALSETADAADKVALPSH